MSIRIAFREAEKKRCRKAQTVVFGPFLGFSSPYQDFAVLPVSQSGTNPTALLCGSLTARIASRVAPAMNAKTRGASCRMGCNRGKMPRSPTSVGQVRDIKAQRLRHG